MRNAMLAFVVMLAAAACHVSTCRDACQDEREECLEEAGSQREEDMCRAAYEQCFWVCDDDELQFQLDASRHPLETQR